MSNTDCGQLTFGGDDNDMVHCPFCGMTQEEEVAVDSDEFYEQYAYTEGN